MRKNPTMQPMEPAELRDLLQSFVNCIKRPEDIDDELADDLLINAQYIFQNIVFSRMHDPNCPPHNVLTGPPPRLALYSMAILLTFVDSGFKPTTANEWAVAEA